MTQAAARPHRRTHGRRTASASPGRRRSTARWSACSTSASPAATCSSIGSSSCLVERRRQGAALQEAHLHQAGAGRPAPRDRHPVHAGDRGARRLRQLHVVQCARHRRSGTPGLPGVFVASAEFVDGRRRTVARRSASPTWRGCSPRTPSRTAPTTRCAPTPTRPTMPSSHRSPPDHRRRLRGPDDQGGETPDDEEHC